MSAYEAKCDTGESRASANDRLCCKFCVLDHKISER
jgi:hypothetical protein